ncbi:MAG: hypothetical protein ACTHJM_06830 [Marmoricola sp.]
MNDRPNAAPESSEERRRRLAKSVGDDEPTQTRDDQPDPREDNDRSKDAWLKAQVPPHHG